MRVTAEAKEMTRRKILDAAESLFKNDGFEGTTTRDIARAAGIATGTLFNYFPTKEAIVLALVADSHARPSRRNSAAVEPADSLEEALFAHAAAGLRLLKPYRRYLAPVLDTSLSPLAAEESGDPGQTLRTGHLERVVELVREHGLENTLTPAALQMYWSLYLGVLAYWTHDRSPKQEDTLALLDQSLEMFTGWLSAAADRSPQSLARFSS